MKRGVRGETDCERYGRLGWVGDQQDVQNTPSRTAEKPYPCQLNEQSVSWSSKTASASSPRRENWDTRRKRWVSFSRFRVAHLLVAVARACERSETTERANGEARPVSREPSKTNGVAVSRANEGLSELVLSVDEERRPGDRPEGGLRMSERRSREQKAEHRSRLGRFVARCGAGAVTTSLRFQFSAHSWIQSHNHHGLSLSTVTHSVLKTSLRTQFSGNATPRSVAVGWYVSWRGCGHEYT